MEVSRGLLYIVSGFSGAGKGTIVKEYMERNGNARLSVSATTRECRKNEKEGVHYYYISMPEFEQMIAEGQMLEYTKYLDNYYGTPRNFVLQKLDQGKDVILEIEMQGALQVKQNFPEAIMIFVCPPHAKDLRTRLKRRATETDDKIMNRLRHSYEEVDLMSKYDYVIVNQTVNEAVRTLESISRAERTRFECYPNIQQRFKQELKELIG